MKARILSLLFFVMFVVSSCSAAEIEMKQSYDLGETFVAKVSGNFVQPIIKTDVSFYRRHLPTAFDISILKLDSDYYIYAQVPFEKFSDNYSVVVNTKVLQGTQAKEENIFYNFSITNKTADFSINPPVIDESSDFSISIQNLKDNPLSIKISVLGKDDSTSGGFFSFFDSGSSQEKTSFILNSGETRIESFKIEDLEEGVNKIRIKSDTLEYILPVKITKEKELPKFSFKKEEINVYLKINVSESKNIQIFNIGNESIKDISLYLSSSLKPYANLSEDSIIEIKTNSSKNISLSFFSNQEVYIQGFLKAKQGEDERIIYINFNSTRGNVSNISKDNNTEIPVSSKICSELGGTPCKERLECEGNLVEASDDRCCVGECKISEGSSLKKIIGWSLLVIIILSFVWFLASKYLGTKNKPNFSSIIRR